MINRIYKRGHIWYADYTDPQTRIRKRIAVGSSKQEALSVAAKARAQVVEGKFFDVKKTPSVTFESLVAEYLTWAKANKKTWMTDALYLRRFSREWPGKLLREITPYLVDQYKAKRSQEHHHRANRLITGHTVNHELACLKTVFNKAMAWEKAQANPVQGIKFYKVDHLGLSRYLSLQEIDTLLKACQETTAHLWAVVMLALQAGMRRGELLALKWADVDYRANMLHVRQSKSGKSRAIPLNEQALEALRACVTVQRLVEAHESPYVFCKASGEPFVNIKRSFMRACRVAGIKQFRFHDLRHTFASHLAIRGVSLYKISQLLGHKSTEMTMRYAKLSPDTMAQAVTDIYGMAQIWHNPTSGQVVDRKKVE